MKVLIVKTSALGDVVHALPVLAWIRSADREAEIHWLVEEAFAPLLEEHPLVHKVHRINTRAWRKAGVLSSLGGILEAVRELRRQRFDLVLDLQGNSKSGLFTRLSGAPRRFGFAAAGVREWPNLLATNHRVVLRPEDFHVSARSLAVARTAFPNGSSSPDAGPLPVGDAARNAVRQKLQRLRLEGHPFAVLHPGTTWSTKEWSVEGWQEVAEGLGRQGLPVLLSWAGKKEQAEAAAVARGGDGDFRLWPPGSLPELAALLREAELVLGPDTGPVHMAAAVGTPTVSLYRATDPRRNGPRGEQHRHLATSLECAACLRKTCAREAECREGISPSRVLAAVSELRGKVG